MLVYEQMEEFYHEHLKTQTNIEMVPTEEPGQEPACYKRQISCHILVEVDMSPPWTELSDHLPLPSPSTRTSKLVLPLMERLVSFDVAYLFSCTELTAGLEVTQVKPDLRVQGEAPGGHHLVSWVPAEVVAVPELWVFLGQAVTVGVLRTPGLALMPRLSGAQGPPVVGPAAIKTALI